MNPQKVTERPACKIKKTTAIRVLGIPILLIQANTSVLHVITRFHWNVCVCSGIWWNDLVLAHPYPAPKTSGRPCLPVFPAQSGVLIQSQTKIQSADISSGQPDQRMGCHCPGSSSLLSLSDGHSLVLVHRWTNTSLHFFDRPSRISERLEIPLKNTLFPLSRNFYFVHSWIKFNFWKIDKSFETLYFIHHCAILILSIILYILSENIEKIAKIWILFTLNKKINYHFHTKSEFYFKEEGIQVTISPLLSLKEIQILLPFRQKYHITANWLLQGILDILSVLFCFPVPDAVFVYIPPVAPGVREHNSPFAVRNRLEVIPFPIYHLHNVDIFTYPI